MPRGDVLVVIFLRGAADALNMLVPHGDAAYYALRPTLGIARPDDPRTAITERVIDLDGFFGLHPALRAVVPMWQAKHLAFVHACGAPDESRSHFKAMDLMERGVASEQGPGSGWIGRHLATLNTNNDSPLRSVAIGNTAPRSLSGTVPTSVMRSITDFHLGSAVEHAQVAARFQSALQAMYDSPAVGDLHGIGQQNLALTRTLEKLSNDPALTSESSQYPQSELGAALRQVATLIKAEVGLEVAALDMGGWDTHFAQGGATGWMAALLMDLSLGLAALHADLHAHLDRLSVVVMSEFGRRAGENGSLGTDHGHGGLMWLLGGQVNGGQVHGAWPGLHADQLIGPGDLAVTTDYRDVLGELCQRRLNNPHRDDIFPNHRPRAVNVWR